MLLVGKGLMGGGGAYTWNVEDIEAAVAEEVVVGE